MIITDKQIEILKPYIENLEELIQKDDVDALLMALDDVIVDNIIGNHDEPDEEGIRLQRIYDEIFNQCDLEEWIESGLPQDGWKLKEDAPDEIKIEYQAFMEKMDEKGSVHKIY